MAQGKLEQPALIRDHNNAMHSSPRRNKIKVLIAMFFAVVFGSLGDVLLSKGMKSIGCTEYECAYNAFVATVTSPYVIAGIGFMICFLLLYLASLSWEELSYVLPLTAAVYVVVTIMAFFWLHEDVSPLRWAGTVLVAAGIALVARS